VLAGCLDGGLEALLQLLVGIPGQLQRSELLLYLGQSRFYSIAGLRNQLLCFGAELLALSNLLLNLPLMMGALIVQFGENLVTSCPEGFPELAVFTVFGNADRLPLLLQGFG